MLKKTVTIECDICGVKFTDEKEAEEHDRTSHLELKALIEKIKAIKLVRVAEWSKFGSIGEIGVLTNVIFANRGGVWGVEYFIRPLINFCDLSAANVSSFTLNWKAGEKDLCEYVHHQLVECILPCDKRISSFIPLDILKLRDALQFLRAQIGALLQQPLFSDAESAVKAESNQGGSGQPAAGIAESDTLDNTIGRFIKEENPTKGDK